MGSNLLFLIGYMGCGKTTLGKRLAARLGRRFVDTDREIERREGASVNEIFNYAGEEYFRRREREVLEAAIADPAPKVISTGGGLPVWQDNMERMNAAGVTVYLRRSPANIASRLSPYGRARRPKLRGLNDEELIDFMTRNMAERAPYYEAAQLMLDGDRFPDGELVEQIRNTIHRNNSPIGVYDSGMGGLTVWRELRRALPHESLLFLGDGKNCPYGARPRGEICELADRAVGALAERGCKLIVVACNTATAAAIDFLRGKYAGIPIVGMEPAVKPACLHTKSGVVGVLATERSLDGELFRRTAARYGRDVEIVTLPGRGFVELVEGDLEDSPRAEACVRPLVEEMLARGVDQIVLGCTHYPFLRRTIERIAEGRGVEIVDPSPAVARRVVQLLDEGGLHAASDAEPVLEYLTFADEDYRLKLKRKAESVDPLR